jgi:hypothetical protein
LSRIFEACGFGLLHRLSDAFLVERLQQVVDGIDLERLHRILVKSRGKHNLGQGNFSIEKFFDNSKAVESGHLDIEKDQIRAVFFDEADGLETVLPLGHDVDVARAREQVGKFIAGELLIVHDYRRKGHAISHGQRPV